MSSTTDTRQKRFSKHSYYRNKKVPTWWLEYLPNPKNPYKHKDSITLQIGALKNFWRAPYSNRHQKVANFMQDTISDIFGTAFTSNSETNSVLNLRYENAYLEDNLIHIKNAHLYYEDVIKFMLKVMEAVTAGHMCPIHHDAIQMNCWFTKTDKEQQLGNHLYEKCQSEMNDYFKKNDIILSNLQIDGLRFSPLWFHNDGWCDKGFTFSSVSHNTLPYELYMIYTVDEKSINPDWSDIEYFTYFQHNCVISFSFFLSCSLTQGNITASYNKSIPVYKIHPAVIKHIHKICENAIMDYKLSAGVGREKNYWQYYNMQRIITEYNFDLRQVQNVYKYTLRL